MKIRDCTVSVVYFVDLWRADRLRVFHRGDYHDTACGLPLWDRLRGDLRADVVALPPAIGLQIGRPCERCFPSMNDSASRRAGAAFEARARSRARKSGGGPLDRARA